MRRKSIYLLPAFSLLFIFVYFIRVFLETKCNILKDFSRHSAAPLSSSSPHGSSKTFHNLVKKLQFKKLNRSLLQSSPDQSEFIYILDWTNYFHYRIGDEQLAIGCPNLGCRLIDDRRLLAYSAAVLFSAPNLNPLDLPIWRPNWQIYGYVMLESRSFVRMHLRDFENSFNVTITYRPDSTIVVPYGYFEPIIPQKKSLDNGFLLKIRAKTKLIAWFVSHCKTVNRREKLVEHLSKFVPVDIYGQCGSKKCEIPSCDERRILKDYKFYLSFENSVCDYYVTEKFYVRLAQDLVPIVLDENIGRSNRLPGIDFDYFIVATKFRSVKALADYLLYLDKNDTAYGEYFDWKRKYRVVNMCDTCPKLWQSAYCRLCQRLLTDRNRIKTTIQTIPKQGAFDWFMNESNCDNDLVERYLKKSDGN